MRTSTAASTFDDRMRRDDRAHREVTVTARALDATTGAIDLPNDVTLVAPDRSIPPSHNGHHASTDLPDGDTS
jgi:hypothetical protein